MSIDFITTQRTVLRISTIQTKLCCERTIILTNDIYTIKGWMILNTSWHISGRKPKHILKTNKFPESSRITQKLYRKGLISFRHLKTFLHTSLSIRAIIFHSQNSTSISSSLPFHNHISQYRPISLYHHIYQETPFRYTTTHIRASSCVILPHLSGSHVLLLDTTYQPPTKSTILFHLCIIQQQKNMDIFEKNSKLANI